MKPPQEYKVVSLRECPTPDASQICETPQHAADYWRLQVAGHPYYNPDCECLVVLLLNVRRRVNGQQLVAVGSLDTLLVSSREVFRAAVIVCAAAVTLMHNLCTQAHKLCVQRRLMCSHRPAGLTSTRVLRRKECCARN
jgi:DNA repair protein RadC